MEEIAEVSRIYTKRFLELVCSGKRYNIPLEFKFSAGLNMADLDSSLNEFESFNGHMVIPPIEAVSNVQVFNFDDRKWSSGPCFPKGAQSHNATIYVSSGGRQWSQEFYLWSNVRGRTKEVLKLIFKVEGNDIKVYYDGIYGQG